jgi:nucleotide-binding universal stress UspA family protein
LILELQQDRREQFVTMFQKILVASDGSESGCAATLFAAEMSQAFGAAVETCVIPAHGRGIRSGEDDSARQIIEMAGVTKADVIVLGMDRRRIGRHLAERGVRDRVAQSTHLPVVVPPTPLGAGDLDVVRSAASTLPAAPGQGRLQHV